MKNIFNKTNAPYLVAGALATATLLASGVFAVAPYIGFLAPVAALSVGLPFIIGGAIISAVAIALSAVAINKNKTDKAQPSSCDYLDLAVPASKQEQRANSLDYLNIDSQNVSKQLDLSSKEAAIRCLKESSVGK